VLVDCDSTMLVAREEIFGPVIPLFAFETEEQVIEMANSTAVGLAAYIFSRDIGRIWRLTDSLQVGMVGVNEGIISNEVAPFGGIKDSGFGREGSRHGIDEYLDKRYICMGNLAQV
jgi:acyl-CoA reductase-like NAD-dependent aldehyde dehydrogenase